MEKRSSENLISFLQCIFSDFDFFSTITDDEDRLRQEMKDLIDDRPIEDESDADSDTSGGNAKRKKSDDEDELDDRLEDEDYELIEENLGVKVDRVRV